MNEYRTARSLAVVLLLSITPTLLLAQYEITSHTIDGGGGFSAGGSFELEGTIGQHDAGPNDGMTGGGFALVGGFWAGAVPACGCLGDMNGDGARNGSDIQQFVDCVVSGGSCTCADVNGVNGIGLDDVPAFVADLLVNGGCP